jgi:hypothetical protein
MAKTDPKQFELVQTPGVLSSPFQEFYRCTACQTVVRPHQMAQHAEECTVGHMQAVLRTKNARKKK